MKKITNFLLAASVIALSASCNKEIDQVVPDQTAKSTVLTAHLDNGVNTRTTLSGNDVFWSTDDAIMAFVGTASYTSTQTEVSNDGATAKFTFEGSIKPTYAFYPVDDNAQIDNSGVITTTIPSEQVAAPGTFANGASLAIAKVEDVDDIHFKNVGALVAFKINATEHNIVSMTLYGTETSGKGMTGQVAVSIASNEVTTQCSGEDHVTVSGVLSVGNLYYAVIAPGTYSDVKIVFTDDEGKTATYIKDDNLVVNRNDHLILGGFSPDSRWKVEKKYYTKVTSTDNLTSGQYLIVYEDGNVAFNGGLGTLDAVSNTISVTIDDGTIESNSTTDAASFYIDITSGTIQSASGYYIGATSNSNSLNSSTTTAYTNTISIDSEGNAVVVSSGGAYLRYNFASNQERFRYFKSSTYTSQKAIALYALATSARTPAELSFSSPTAEAFVGQTGFTGPELTKNPANITVSWSSSNTEVAFVDETGAITLKKAGTARITASFAGNSEYAPATAFYTLTVNPAYTITLQNVNDGKVFVGAASSSSVKFKVTSSYAWESNVSFANGFNESFSVTPAQNGAGEVEVTVNCTVENQSEDDRQLGTITISNDGDEKTIQVWQFGFSDEPTTYKMTISSSQNPDNSHCNVVWYREANKTLTHDGISWNASVEGTLNFVGANDWCTIGTKDDPATKITLSTTGFAGKTIVAARLKGNCGSNTGPVLSITAGSTKMLENEPLVKTTATVYESSNGNVELSAGEALTFEITSSVQAGIQIYYVEVEYK